MEFDYLHYGAWRDAYECKAQKLILKVHLGPREQGKSCKGSNANEQEWLQSNPGLPTPAVLGFSEVHVEGPRSVGHLWQ